MNAVYREYLAYMYIHVLLPFLASQNEELLHYPRLRQNVKVFTLVFYVMGKTLIGELSCPMTGLVMMGAGVRGKGNSHYFLDNKALPKWVCS